MTEFVSAWHPQTSHVKVPGKVDEYLYRKGMMHKPRRNEVTKD